MAAVKLPLVAAACAILLLCVSCEDDGIFGDLYDLSSDDLLERALSGDGRAAVVVADRSVCAGEESEQPLSGMEAVALLRLLSNMGSVHAMGSYGLFLLSGVSFRDNTLAFGNTTLALKYLERAAQAGDVKVRARTRAHPSTRPHSRVAPGTHRPGLRDPGGGRARRRRGRGGGCARRRRTGWARRRPA